MNDTLTPWEPPLSGSADEHLVAALDRLRWTFRWKADGLDAAGLSARVGASSLTIGGLLKHLTHVEATKFTGDLDGGHPGEPWASVDDEWAFTSAADDAPEALYAGYDAAVARSRAIVADAVAAGRLDEPIALGRRYGVTVSLRRLLSDLVEEYGRHTGHADLLREAVDGLVGEDPPEGWRPVGGSVAFG